MSAIPDSVFVSWTQNWTIDEYIDHYVRSRRLPPEATVRESIRARLRRFTGRRPYLKSDLDFYLDANVGRR